MNKDFYNNPFKVIWAGRNEIMPKYLKIIWSTVFIVLCLGLIFNKVDLAGFKAGNYLSVCITGLSFTLALFVATRNIFDIEELKILRDAQDSSGGKQTPLFDLFAPFIFTALTYLILAIISILAPFIVIEVSEQIHSIGSVIYIMTFILATLSLFNLLNMIFNDIYHKAGR